MNDRRVSGNLSRDGSRVGNGLVEGELDRFGDAKAETASAEEVWFQPARPGQDCIAFGLDLGPLPLVHLVGRQVVQSAVHVVPVVPGHQGVHVGFCLVQGVGVIGERCPPLEGCKQAFDEGVVVADMGATAGVTDFELFEESSESGRSHRASVVGMDSQGCRVRHPVDDDLGEQIMGQLSVLGKLHGPVDGLAAEHVLDGVEVEVGTPHRRGQVSDVPGPDLVHCRGFQDRRTPLW